jgi:hypothetical protein
MVDLVDTDLAKVRQVDQPGVNSIFPYPVTRSHVHIAWFAAVPFTRGSNGRLMGDPLPNRLQTSGSAAVDTG